VGGGRTTATETSDAIQIQAGDVTVQISRASGMLVSAQRGPQRFSLTNGPRPVTGTAVLTNLQWKADGADYLVGAEFSGDLKSVLWLVRGNGWITCEYVYSVSGTNESQGIVFDYPEAFVQKKRWLGEGPYRVWQNRRQGGTLFLWDNDYNNTFTGWSDWIYPEFKGSFAGVRWLQLQTREGLLTFVPSDIPFVQVLTPELPPTNLVARTALMLPSVGVGFLHAIPPTGNKFHSARDTGPQGRQTLAPGEYSGTISFYLGPLP
jgi:hypothetical protein